MVKAGYHGEASRRKELEKHDWLVWRVSGSHGPIDLVAIKQCSDFKELSDVDNELLTEKKIFKVKLEQVKYTSQGKYRLDKLALWELTRCIEIQKKFNVPIFWVIKYRNERGWEVNTLDDMIEKYVKGKINEKEIELDKVD